MTNTPSDPADHVKRRFRKNGRLTVSPAEVEISVVSAIDSYRRLAGELPTPADRVLEIGCSTGETTRALAATGATVVAVDKSAEAIQELQEEMRGLENVRVAAVDGRDMPTLADLLPTPTLIFIDIGGDAHLDHVALQLRLCLRAFRPRQVVVRSFELAGLVAVIGEVEPPLVSNLLATEDHAFGRDPLSNLLELSYSSRADIRLFSARRLSRYDAPQVRDRLRAMISDPHPGVRRAATRAMQALEVDRPTPAQSDEG